MKLWAGLRVVNETGFILRRAVPDLFRRPDEEFWACVIQARDISLSRWVQALKLAFDPESEDEAHAQLASWAEEVPESALEGLGAPAPMIAYRLMAAPKRAEAARLLAGGRWPVEKGKGFGKLIERPDVRLRINVARLAGGTHLASLAAFGAWHAGKKLAPKLTATLVGG